MYRKMKGNESLQFITKSKKNFLLIFFNSRKWFKLNFMFYCYNTQEVTSCTLDVFTQDRVGESRSIKNIYQ